jgi:hypothetical protein
MNKAKKIATLRSKLDFRGPVNTLRVNPAYIRVVRRLQELNNTPNNNYEKKDKTSTGWHARRIQRMQNLLDRLVLTNNGIYRNRNRNNNYYNFNKGSLTAVPRNRQRGVYVSVARGLSKRPNGSLYFNL